MHIPSFAAAICVLMLAFSARAAEPLRFGTFNNTYSPRLHVCERVLREAYGKLGRTFEIEHLPAERSLYWAGTGRLDGDLCRAQQQDDLLLIPTPVYYWRLNAFSTRPIPTQSWADLKPYKIAFERGMRIIDQHHELQLIPANTIELAVLLVAKGRANLLLNDYNSVLYAIKRLKITNLIVNEPPLIAGPTYHLLNKRHAELAQQINAVLEQMAKQGRIRQIETEVMDEFLLRAEREPSSIPQPERDNAPD